VDDGLIGEPVGVAGFITSNRVETWHPDPTFRFQPGGGPVPNMGPYHLTAMVNLLGPLTSVVARGRIGAPVRAVTSPGRRVEAVTVTTPTHVAAVLEFASGVIGTLLASYDVWDHHLPHLEVYGTLGTLALPDPNEFDGDVRLRRHTDDGWQVLPPVLPLFAEPGSAGQLQRGPGVADLVAAVGGTPHRAGAALACHVLDAIEAIETSVGTGAGVGLTTRVDRPEPVRPPLRP
jgi:predicted dehydrogenase